MYDNPWFVYALEKRDRLYTELKKPQQSKNDEDIDYDYFEDEYESLSDEAEECMVHDFVQLLGLEEEKYDDGAADKILDHMVILRINSVSVFL